MCLHFVFQVTALGVRTQNKSVKSQLVFSGRREGRKVGTAVQRARLDVAVVPLTSLNRRIRDVHVCVCVACL
jgi:hypothetical protein